MLTQSSSGMNRIVTSLKVAAVVSILGAVVLAAEHQVGTSVPSEPTAPSASAMSSQADSTAEPADYFPAQFPAPSGPVAEQPASF
jgi:hypothetical protein